MNSFPAIIAIILTGVSIFVIVKARSTYHRLQNQRAAWPYLERIAYAAFMVTRDRAAPDVVNKVINAIADRAFDEKFYHDISNSEVPDATGIPFSSQITNEYGRQYGEIMREVIEALAFVIVLNDTEVGVSLRRFLNRKRREKAKLRHDRSWIERVLEVNALAIPHNGIIVAAR